MITINVNSESTEREPQQRNGNYKKNQMEFLELQTTNTNIKKSIGMFNSRSEMAEEEAVNLKIQQ